MGPNVLALAPRVALALEGNDETRRRMERAGVDVRVYRGRRDLAQGRRRPDLPHPPDSAHLTEGPVRTGPSVVAGDHVEGGS